jgi:hypothetical protein
MVLMYEDTSEITYKARSESRDSFYRLRSPKAVRGNRGIRRNAAAPGGIRQRRNKHWNW